MIKYIRSFLPHNLIKHTYDCTYILNSFIFIQYIQYSTYRWAGIYSLQTVQRLACCKCLYWFVLQSILKGQCHEIFDPRFIACSYGPRWRFFTLKNSRKSREIVLSIYFPDGSFYKLILHISTISLIELQHAVTFQL